MNIFESGVALALILLAVLNIHLASVSSLAQIFFIVILMEILAVLVGIWIGIVSHKMTSAKRWGTRKGDGG